jgi:hypothetical protein
MKLVQLYSRKNPIGKVGLTIFHVLATLLSRCSTSWGPIDANPRKNTPKPVVVRGHLVVLEGHTDGLGGGGALLVP